MYVYSGQEEFLISNSQVRQPLSCHLFRLCHLLYFSFSQFSFRFSFTSGSSRGTVVPTYLYYFSSPYYCGLWVGERCISSSSIYLHTFFFNSFFFSFSNLSTLFFCYSETLKSVGWCEPKAISSRGHCGRRILPRCLWRIRGMAKAWWVPP